MVRGKGRQVVRSLVRRKGFTFPQGELFGDRHTMCKILRGVFGDKRVTSDNLPESAEQWEDALTVLFHHLVDRGDTYCLLRGHDAFYDTLAAEFPGDGDLTGDLLKTLEVYYVDGRKAYQGIVNHNSRLVQAVDAWIQVKDATSSLPPLQSFSLSARPTGVEGIISSLQKVDINSTSSWPPSYFNADEVTIISMNYLRPLLHGRTPENPGSLPTTPNNKTNPKDIRGFLCALALMHYNAHSMWNLGLRPAAQFAASSESFHWSTASGGESRFCITLQRCMADAVAFLKSGKVMSISLATPWFGRTWGSIPCVDDLLNAAGKSQEDVWSALCPRQGFAIVLHKQGTDVELVVFDPIHRYDYVKTDPIVKSNLMAIFSFRQAIQENARKAVEDAGGRIVRAWYGGRMDAVDGQDSVQMASDWIRQLVVASTTSDPLAISDSDWARLGFEAITM